MIIDLSTDVQIGNQSEEDRRVVMKILLGILFTKKEFNINKNILPECLKNMWRKDFEAPPPDKPIRQDRLPARAQVEVLEVLLKMTQESADKRPLTGSLRGEGNKLVSS